MENKTILTKIRDFVLGLEDEKVNRDFLERALNGVDRISHLLEDLDEISKYESNRTELKIKKVDIVEIAKSTVKSPVVLVNFTSQA